jgi:hypothetical protein
MNALAQTVVEVTTSPLQEAGVHHGAEKAQVNKVLELHVGQKA